MEMSRTDISRKKRRVLRPKKSSASKLTKTELSNRTEKVAQSTGRSASAKTLTESKSKKIMPVFHFSRKSNLA
jgi:hypothetical protein